jgi:hypothetical protein
MPGDGDRNVAVQYTWESVEALQCALVDSVEDSLERGAKINNLVSQFNTAMQKRGLVLGESTPFTATETGYQAVTTPVASGALTQTSTSSRRQIERPTVSLNRNILILREGSNTSIQKAIINAGKGTISGIVRLIRGLSLASGEYSTSEEAKETRQSLNLAGNAASEFRETLSRTFKAVGSSWSQEMGDPSDEIELDEYVARMGKAVKSVATSTEVRKELDESSRNAQKVASEVSLATKFTLSKLSSSMAENETLDEALFEITEASKVIAASVTVATTRALDKLDK